MRVTRMNVSIAIVYSCLLTTHHATEALNVLFVYSESIAYSFFFQRMEKLPMLRSIRFDCSDYIEIDANRRRFFFSSEC